MGTFLAVRFNQQVWGFDLSYVAGTGATRQVASAPTPAPGRFYFQNRLIPLVNLASLCGVASMGDSASPYDLSVPWHIVVLKRGWIRFGVRVEKVLQVLKLDFLGGPWRENCCLPLGMSAGLIQGVGTTADGRVIPCLKVEALIAQWQEQQGESAFPIPHGPRLGEVNVIGDSVQKEIEPERRGHLRLDHHEWVLIRKSRESGYPAYRAVISLEKSFKDDPSYASPVVELLQQMGTVIHAEAIYHSKGLGKNGRHLGLFYISEHPPETILARLHDLEEVDRAELIKVTL